ncbi:50S ribosomal protein L23 [Candidatus Saccharibacteria bacterium]|nr:50S ribosomal protein L23 [Candidatus Saccharibacteria bacterium]
MADTKKTTAVVKLNLLEPRATEKAYAESFRRTYIFSVDRSLTKQAIAALVAREHNVTVTDVRVLTRKGKQTRFSKGKHAYPGLTFRRDHKFAYVTLKDGDSIKVFETTSVNSDGSAEQSSDKKAKKSDAKDAQKEAKTSKKADKNAAKEKN